MERDSRHLDNMIGPLVVAVGLMLALIFNFSFGFKKIYQSVALDGDFYDNYPVHYKIHKFIAENL